MSAGNLINFAGQVLPFGKDKPVLYINDRIGYEIEKPDVISKLNSGCFDPLIEIIKSGLEQEVQTVNLQLMRHELDEKKLYPALLEKAMELGIFIAIDTHDPALVEQSLRIYSPGKALCNIITGETERLRTMLPIIAKYGGAIGTALVDEKGIPETVKDRVAVALKIVEAAEAYGIPREDIAIDAVCLPAGVCIDSPRVTFETMKALDEELGVPILLGVSNVGYMMPSPSVIEVIYCILASGFGLSVAMVDPFMPHFKWVKKTVDFLLGSDAYAVEYLDYYRKQKKGVD